MRRYSLTFVSLFSNKYAWLGATSANGIFLQKSIKLCTKFVNNCVLYIKNDNFKFYVGITIMALYIRQHNHFSYNKVSAKNTKVNVNKTNSMFYDSLSLYWKRNLKQQRNLNMNFSTYL